MDDGHILRNIASSPMASFPFLAKALIERIHKEYSTLNDISNDLLVSLYNCFGVTFERALKLADMKPLIVYESSSGQKLWKVESMEEKSIYILPHVNFCQCDAFKYQVLVKNTAITCKHYLAAELNYARKMYELEKISDKKMTDFFVSVYIAPRCR